MASAMNVSDTEMDSDATYCEEAENNEIDAKLDEIQNNIRRHHLQQVFMTKPQMRGYREFLTTILPHMDTQKQCLAKTFLAHLEQIAKIVEDFERKWSSDQSMTSASDDVFPCSLLTNQDFVSQVCICVKLELDVLDVMVTNVLNAFVTNGVLLTCACMT